MEAGRYILRSLAHYRFAHAGVFLGVILGATALLGALFAGDSVKASLLRLSGLRTGQATHLLTAGERVFRDELAVDLARAAGVVTAPVLFLRGTAVSAVSQAAANEVQLLGVTDAFWTLAPAPTQVTLPTEGSGVAINETLARRLELAVGDTLIVRFQKPGVLSGGAPVAGAAGSLESLRCVVAALVGDGAFGRFSLETIQIPQPSVYLPLGVLQDRLGKSGRANLVLIDAGESGGGELREALGRSMELADYGLTLTFLETAGAFEVTSGRVFIDPAISRAISAAVPSADPVVSYLVNEMRHGDRTTPYSIVTATTSELAPFLPAGLGADEIVLNDWLAEDLRAGPGDMVSATFFLAGDSGGLEEASRSFRVRSIVPLEGLAADRSWMPPFPGISEAETPNDWDAGLPLDLGRIRDKDEAYWEEHRGTPKAFIAVEAAREAWSNRWGDDTALRVAGRAEDEAGLAATILGALRPEMNQMRLSNFKADAERAAMSPVDFGGLFLGMSFFLIAAAVGLVAMLFRFFLLQRNREDALLGSVGVSPARLLSWRLGEGAVVVLLGCLAALPLAAIHTRQVLHFLETIWSGQGGSPTFAFSAARGSAVAGVAGFAILVLLVLWLSILRQARRALSIRLAASAEEAEFTRARRRRSIVVGTLSAATGIAALVLSGGPLPAQGAFFLAGFALLVAGLAACRLWLGAPDPQPRHAELDPARMGRLNIGARRSRSLTVVGLIATAVFMVLSVSSFRKNTGDEWRERDSGTGGFALWVETTAPQNPARDALGQGFEIFRSQRQHLSAVVPIRQGAGDNANCYNLNTTGQPRLLGLDATALAQRGAFEVSHEMGWTSLRASGGEGAVPALVDQTTLMWALKRKVGDVLSYTDEHGAPFDVRIAGTIKDSIFQGHLVIDERKFLERFPSSPGYSIFLVDLAPDANPEVVRAGLETSISHMGGRAAVTREILDAFFEIENTYIAIFTVLGSLGVLLGSLGLAIVVARSMDERRGEFAVMLAVGIPRRVMASMVFCEYRSLVAWGLAVGGVAALLAVWPNLGGIPAVPAIILVCALLLGVVVLNLLCGWLVFVRSFRGICPRLEQIAR